MEINDVIYEEENGKVKVEFRFDSLRQKGVWALFGKESAQSDYICLNVGKCVDVGYEIIYDIGCMKQIEFRNDGEKEYINQFGESCKFKYKKNQVQEYLYPFIKSCNYYALKFVLVHNENCLDKEREYAIEHQAKFWRNGKPYEKAKVGVSE